METANAILHTTHGLLETVNGELECGEAVRYEWQLDGKTWRLTPMTPMAELVHPPKPWAVRASHVIATYV